MITLICLECGDIKRYVSDSDIDIEICCELCYNELKTEMAMLEASYENT